MTEQSKDFNLVLIIEMFIEEIPTNVALYMYFCVLIINGFYYVLS